MSAVVVVLLCVGYVACGGAAAVALATWIRRRYDSPLDELDMAFVGAATVFWPAFVVPVLCFVVGRAAFRAAARIEARR